MSFKLFDLNVPSAFAAASERGAAAATRRRVTFIRGIMQRSGTNYLYDLLATHPDFAVVEPLWEDHVVDHLRFVERYVDGVSSSWNPAWGADGLGSRLAQSIGDGICRFLDSRASGDAPRVLTKSPHVRDFRCAAQVFPGETFLIVVRDGRDVVESTVKSFGWRYETAIRTWAEGASEILRFVEAVGPDGPAYKIVRYEDLVTATEKELRSILAFLGLDANTYDFARSTDLPLRGSSQLRDDGGGAVHWRPVAKPRDFNPIGRWADWGVRLRDRFDWVAGPYMEAFGYEREHVDRGIVTTTLHASTDAVGAVRSALGRRRRELRRARAGGQRQ